MRARWALAAVLALLASGDEARANGDADARALDARDRAVRSYEGGDGAAAARAFEEVLELTNGSAEDARVALAIGQAHIHLLRLERAGARTKRPMKEKERLKQALRQAGVVATAAQAAPDARPGRPEADSLANEVYTESGYIEVARRNYPAAASNFRKALKAVADDESARASLGQVLFALGEYAEAAQLLVRAAVAATKRANAQLKQRGSVSADERGKLIGDVFVAFKNAASAQTQWADHPFRWRAAVDVFERAVTAPLLPPRKKHGSTRLDSSAMLRLSKPGAAVRGGLTQADFDRGLVLLRKVATEAVDWRHRAWLERELGRIVHSAWAHRNASLTSSLPFETLVVHPGSPPHAHAVQGAAAAAYCAQVRAEAEEAYGNGTAWLPDEKQRARRWRKCASDRANVGCRLRVAYLSADWRDHPCGRILGSLLAQHNARAAASGKDSRAPLVQASALAINPKPSDPSSGHGIARANLVERLRLGAKKAGADPDLAFVDVGATDERADASRNALDAIKSLNAEIVVDAMGFTSGHLAPVAGLRASPLKVLFIGYAGPLGGCADYVIADRRSLPPDVAARTFGADGRTRVAYLPSAMWYLPTAYAEDPHTSDLAVADSSGAPIRGAGTPEDSPESLGLRAPTRPYIPVSREHAADRIAEGDVDPVILAAEERAMQESLPQRAGDSNRVPLPDGTFVFCTYNAPYKAHAVPYGATMAVLRRVPQSVLHVPLEPEEAFLSLQAEAAAAGVNPLRIVGLPWLDGSQRRHLAAKRHCQLFLDSPSYSAHATAADALWAGVPVLSLAGEMWPGRVSYAATHALLHGDTSAEAAEARELLLPASYRAFEDHAVRLATNPATLARVRRALARARGSPGDAEHSVHPLFGAWEHEWYASCLFGMMHDLRLAGVRRPMALSVAPAVGSGRRQGGASPSAPARDEL